MADLPALRTLGAPFDQVFLMKLYATRVRTSDVADMVALWPRTGFASADQAVELYYQACPLAEVDPFLTAYVADLTGAPEHAEVPARLILNAPAGQVLSDVNCRPMTLTRELFDRSVGGHPELVQIGAGPHVPQL
ncbi:MAG: hypothetical protein KY451_14245 [Actinobacteria bacterium]|nr:hypothetical protein [Actinomycetota bacterium]